MSHAPGHTPPVHQHRRGNNTLTVPPIRRAVWLGPLPPHVTLPPTRPMAFCGFVGQMCGSGRPKNRPNQRGEISRGAGGTTREAQHWLGYGLF